MVGEGELTTFSPHVYYLHHTPSRHFFCVTCLIGRNCLQIDKEFPCFDLPPLEDATGVLNWSTQLEFLVHSLSSRQTVLTNTFELMHNYTAVQRVQRC